MADDAIKFGIVVDTSLVTSRLAEVNSAFKTTAGAVADAWEQSSTRTVISLKQIADEAENSSGQTKDHIEKATKSIDLLGDVIGVKVPDALKKALAESATFGPVLEKAFNGIAIIAVIQLVLEVGRKVSDLIKGFDDLTQAEKDFHDQVVRDASDELNATESRIRAVYAIHIALATGNESLQQQLRVQMNAALVAAHQRNLQQLKEEQLRLQKAAQDARNLQEEVLKGSKHLHIASSLPDPKPFQKAADDMKKVIEQAQTREMNAAAELIAEFKRSLQPSNPQHRSPRITIERPGQEINDLTTQVRQASKIREELKNISDAQSSGARESEKALIDLNNVFADQAKKNLAELYRSTSAYYRGQIELAEGQAQVTEALAARDLVQGKITKQQEIEIVRDAKLKELEIERQYYQQLHDFSVTNADQRRQLEVQITRNLQQQQIVRAQAVKAAAEADDARWRKQLQDWKNIHKQMDDFYRQSLNSMNSALANFVTSGKFNWQSLVDGLIQDMVRMVLQWIESMILMKVLGMAIGNTAAQANISASAAQGAAAAGASVAAIPYVGWSMVPAVSAATYGLLSGFNAGIAKYELGGIVPQDGIVKVHRGETILPARMSGKGDYALPSSSPGAGHTFNFHVHGTGDPDAVADRVMARVKRHFRTGGVMR